MARHITEPRKAALLYVASGSVYLRRVEDDNGIVNKATWMLNGIWQPPSQPPYNWLYSGGYIELSGSTWRARLTDKGRFLLEALEA